jgi:energy-coupling factor transporter ATP-binding protein EcfA2
LSERSPYTLSGGQQQRLALASILALQPPILLLDEPTAMLDPQGGREIYEIVQQLARAGTAVVAAELHLEWIARYADRVIALSKGEIILDGPPQEVLVSPLLLQAGIGWQRHTQAARLAQEHELWPAGRPLPATLQQAEEGFRAGRKNETRI